MTPNILAKLEAANTEEELTDLGEYIHIFFDDAISEIETGSGAENRRRRRRGQQYMLPDQKGQWGLACGVGCEAILLPLQVSPRPCRNTASPCIALPATFCWALPKLRWETPSAFTLPL
jgi:hypothetical protein